MESRKVIVAGIEEETSILFRMRENGEITFRRFPFLNYFYIKSEDLNEVLQYVLKEMSEYSFVEDFENNQYVKLVFKNNKKRYDYINYFQEKNIEMFENDVNAVKRFMTTTDLSFQNTEDLVVGYLDIETDDRKEMMKDNKGNVIAQTAILSVAIGPQSGDSSNILYFRNQNPDDENEERKLLLKLFDEMKKYDVLSAWNGLAFDFPYIKQRQEKLGLTEYFDWSFVNLLDDLIIFKSFYDRQYKSYSLNNVAKQFIQDEKVSFVDELSEKDSYVNGKFYKMFIENPGLFERYNRKDVELMQLIEKKAKNYRPKLVLTKICQTFIRDTLHNSVLADSLFLRKCHEKNVIAVNKPSKAEQELRKLDVNPGGGYTFCFKPGLNKNVEAFDYKSHYPLIIITFNISPETFVSNMDVDFEEVSTFMSKDELDLMLFSIEIKQKFVKKDGSLKVGYDKEIEKYSNMKNYSFTLEDVMFKFASKYTGKKIEQYAKEHNYIYTPADFNHDTNGWTLHPHRLYKRSIMGVLPTISEEVLNERDKVKYKIKEQSAKNINFVDSEEHLSLHYYQIALKVLGNSLFGVLGAVHTRLYKYDVVDTITTVGRWILKKSILVAKQKDAEIIAGDTDSIFIKFNVDTEKERLAKINELNMLYFDTYKQIFSSFNTIYKKEQKNKRTNEVEIVPFWCEFEWEHTYQGMITIAKKRYYYIETFKDNSGHVKYKIESRGGAFLKTDTNPLAAKLQKQLCYELLTDTYNREKFKAELLKYKEQCFNQKLEVKYLIFSKKYTKNHESFGQPIFDSETGNIKKTASGEYRYAPIPVHIKLVKRLEENKVMKFNVGDTIDYIIAKPEFETKETILKSGKVKRTKVRLTSGQQGITVEEYLAGQEYDAETYWTRIIKPVLEILEVADPKAITEDIL